MPIFFPSREPSFFFRRTMISSNVPSLTEVIASSNLASYEKSFAKRLSCVTSRASVPPENPRPGHHQG